MMTYKIVLTGGPCGGKTEGIQYLYKKLIDDGYSVRIVNETARALLELGYMPNVMASHLSSKSSRRIALYVYINDAVQAIDEINMRYLFGAFQMAKESSLELVTCFNDSINHLSNEEFHAYFRSIGTEVIIVFGLNKDDEKIYISAYNDHCRMLVGFC
jgi:LacI family transcriptional regulator